MECRSSSERREWDADAWSWRPARLRLRTLRILRWPRFRRSLEAQRPSWDAPSSSSICSPFQFQNLNPTLGSYYLFHLSIVSVHQVVVLVSPKTE
jgi:hypothetical protein